MTAFTEASPDHTDMLERALDEAYDGPLAPCPVCFESCGFRGEWHKSWDDPGSFQENPNDPCPECHGTGMVEAEPITLEDLEDRAVAEHP